jgi:hypothetical protein
VIIFSILLPTSKGQRPPFGTAAHEAIFEATRFSSSKIKAWRSNYWKTLLENISTRYRWKRTISYTEAIGIYDEVVENLKRGRNVERLVEEFWKGIERTSPRIELTATKLTIRRELVDADEKQS